MDITEVPGQFTRAFKYSTLSVRSFILSLVSAILLMAFTGDQLISFFYTRTTGVKDFKYSGLQWVLLACFALVIPIAAGACQLILQYGWLVRRFRGDQYGIAIAPFKVISQNVETLGVSSKRQALDGVLAQTLETAAAITEKVRGKALHFRILPPPVRVHSPEDAIKWHSKLDATLIIWGQLFQSSEGNLKLDYHLYGSPAFDLHLEGPLTNNVWSVPFLKFFALLAAGLSEKASRHYDTAKDLYTRAAPLAAELDKTTQKTVFQPILSRLIGELNEAEAKHADVHSAPARHDAD